MIFSDSFPYIFGGDVGSTVVIHFVANVVLAVVAAIGAVVVATVTTVVAASICVATDDDDDKDSVDDTEDIFLPCVFVKEADPMCQ